MIIIIIQMPTSPRKSESFSNPNAPMQVSVNNPECLVKCGADAPKRKRRLTNQRIIVIISCRASSSSSSSSSSL